MHLVGFHFKNHAVNIVIMYVCMQSGFVNQCLPLVWLSGHLLLLFEYYKCIIYIFCTCYALFCCGVLYSSFEIKQFLLGLTMRWLLTRERNLAKF